MLKTALINEWFGMMQASALIIFFTVLLLVTFWAYRPKGRELYARIQNDPLDLTEAGTEDNHGTK